MNIERWLLPLTLLAVACDSTQANEATAADDADATGRSASALAAESSDAAATTPPPLPNNTALPNPQGAAATFSTQGSVSFENDFFGDFGTNDRSCGTCHTPLQAWSVSAADVQRRFDASNGLDPIFRPVDGANSPNANVATLAARRNAYSMLRTRGVIRVGLPVPAGAEFELSAVDDPYGFASAAELSLFRRPLASANLFGRPGAFVMWDGRETQADFRTALSNQANNATLGHAQAAAPLPQTVRNEIVDFEIALFVAQVSDTRAGSLTALGAQGGPQALSTQANAAGPFNLYDAWAGLSGADQQTAARRAIARGQALFNNPNSAAGGACGGCHNVANVGSSTIPAFFNIGVSASSRRTPDLPLYTLRNKTTGATLQSTDPGRALITGLWADIGSFKVPSLRGLSARAPYFHNGSAKTLEEVVKLYEASLGFAFTDAEEADLVAFMKAL